MSRRAVAINSFVNVQVRVLSAQAQAQLAALGNRVGALEGNFSKSRRAASMFGMTLDGMRLDSFGSRIQWIGRQLEYNFTLPILAAAAASFKLALDNEAAFTRVEKVYGDAARGAEFYAKELDALERSFVALSNVYGINQKETIEIAAAWAAAGSSGLALAKSVDLTMKTMILGEMQATEATEALIAIQAQYGLSTAELTKTISVLNMVENQTGISLKGLVQGFARAAGVARSSGVDIRHLAAMMAALVPATGGAAQAGNALKTIFSRLQSPTKETVEVLGLMGIEFGSLQWKSASVTEQLQILGQKFDQLSDKQKGVVSSVVASRWQINKFEVLMRELTSTNGYYARALEATSDQTRVYAQMQRELNTVLSSNPRRLQILWTILQNAAADIIQPLIPLLLYLATAVAKVVTWFSNLNPAVQKVVIGLLLFLALIGPLVRIGGALVLMVASLGHIWALLVAPIFAAAGALLGFLKIPVVAALAAIGAAVRTSVLFTFATLPGLIARATVGIQTALLVGARYAGITWRAGFGVITTITYGILFALPVIFRRAMFLIQGAVLAGAKAVGIAWRAGLVAIFAVQKAWGLLMLVNFRKIFATMAALTAAGLLNLKKLFVGFIPALRAFSLAMLTAMTGPWGIAIGIVVTLLVAFWDEVKAIWSAMVRGTIQAFNALPEGIKNAMLAVVRVVRAAVMAVYRLFSYLNPWARHSPSLVENVTTGVAEIKKQYSSLGAITSIFAKAGLNLESFAQAVAKLQRAAEIQELKLLREDLESIAPNLIPEFNKLVAVLQPLRNLLADIKVQVDAQQAVVDKWKTKLDAANAALDEQQRILDTLEAKATFYADQLDAAQAQLDKFVNAPIEGMKEMADAIFENQMQQKALRLEMLRMEEAVGPLDELKSRVDTLNGAMELLKGEQTALRNAGAGGEILSQYDAQITLLEEQKQAIDEQIAPLQNLADQIDELGRQAEILDLENSLRFDPLKRQVDDLVNSMEELPFDQILAGVIENKAEVDRLTEAYNNAQTAVDRQKAVVEALTAQRDLLQASYDAEEARLRNLQDEYSRVEDKIREVESALQDVGSAAKALDQAAGGGRGMSPGAENFLASAGGNFPDVGGLGALGREGGLADQASMIDDFTKEMAQQTKDMFGLFNFLDPIKKAWNKATGWLKENVGPIFMEIGKSIGGALGEMDNPFDTFKSWGDTLSSVGNTVKKAWDMIWELIGPEVMDILKEAWGGLQDAFKDIQPEIAKFRDLVGPLGEAIGNVFNFIKPGIMIVIGLILMVVKALLGAISGGIGPFVRGIGDLVAGVIKIIRGILEFIIGVFTGDWEMAWTGIKDFFSGIWQAIAGVAKNAVNMIWGIIKGFVMGIVDFFKWLWDELVGHSIVPDIVNGIISWFRKMGDMAKGIWTAFGNMIKTVFNTLVQPVINAFKAGWENVKNGFKVVVDFIKNQWDQMVAKFKSAWALINGIISNIKTGFNTISSTFSSVVSSVGNLVSRLVGYFSGLRDRFSFSGLFNGIVSAFRSAINQVIGMWNSLSFSAGPFSVGTPNIPYMARGGMIASQAMAVVGEGRKGYPEYVIPTDPIYRRRALALFADLGRSLGVQSVLEQATVRNALVGMTALRNSNDRIAFYASGGVLGGTIRRRGGNGSAILVAPTSNNTYHFHGNLEFPNIKSGLDAEEFLSNLEALMNEA